MSKFVGTKAILILDDPSSAPNEISAALAKVMLTQKSHSFTLKNPSGASSGEDAVISYGFKPVDNVEMTMDMNAGEKMDVDEKVDDRKRSIQSSSDVERAVKRQVADALGRAAPPLPPLPLPGRIQYGASAKAQALKHQKEMKQLYKKARKYYDDVAKETRRQIEIEKSRLVHGKSRGLNPMAAPFIHSGSGYENLEVPVETPKMQGECFVLPASLSVFGSYFSSAPLDLTPYPNNSTKQVATDHQVGHARSIRQGAPAQSTSLNPSASPFYLPTSGFEVMGLQDYCSSGLSLGDPFKQSKPITQSSEVHTQHSPVLSAPAATVVINRPFPIRPKKAAVPTTSVHCSASTATQKTLSPARIPIPDLPTRPSTPSLGSLPRFDALSPRPKSSSSRPPLPVVSAKKKRSRRNTNPFFDIKFENGNEAPGRYKFLAYNEEETLNVDGGPYRKAAVWDFIGQTFEKSGRMSKRIRKAKRQTCYVPGFTESPGPSPLSRRVLTFEEEEEALAIQITMEWEAFTNGTPC